MSLDLNAITAAKQLGSNPPANWVLRGVVVLVILATTVGLALAGNRLWQPTLAAYAVVDVEEGDLAVSVTETGTVEAASNTTVKCQVEALIGNVGGASGAGSGRSGGAGQGGAAGAGGAAPAAGVAPNSASASGAAKSKSSGLRSTSSTIAKKKSSSGGGGGAGGGGGGSSSAGGGGGSSSSGGMGGGSSSAGSSPGGSAGGSSGGKSGGSSASGGSSTVKVTPRPTIRSFSFSVPNYQPLRPANRSASTTKAAGGGGGGGAGGRQGGGGGGGGRQGGGGNVDEKPGSTRIMTIKEEGSMVSAGEVVCELDSAAFQDAVLAQRIKTDQARSWKVQALSILEVNDISLREYRDGIFRQDVQLVQQYLSTCRVEEERARNNLAWSKVVLDKGYRAPQQYAADVLSLQRAQVTLSEAELMEYRLAKFTGPKIIKSLESKLQANKADAFAQEAAYQIEADRLKRLQRMVLNCTLRAPHDGMVVYAMPPSNGWRPATAVIQEGATVREGQPIFELPDAKHMRVRVKINESKVAAIAVGQKATILVDAYPDTVLTGVVTDLTLISGIAALGSDVRVNYANVVIDQGGFEGLRTGLSASVTFHVNKRDKATRMPLEAIRWVDRSAFAAVSTSPDRTRYEWKPIKLGLMNESFAEVTDGLKPGDRVVASPKNLPAPVITPSPIIQAAEGDTVKPKG